MHTSVCEVVTESSLFTRSCITSSDAYSVCVVCVRRVRGGNAVDHLSQVWTPFDTKFSRVITEVVPCLWAEGNTRVVEITTILSSNTVMRVCFTMSVMPVGKSTILTVWNTNSSIILGIVNHKVPFVTVSSATSVIVRVSKSSWVAQKDALVSNIITKQSWSCWTCNDTLGNICRYVAIKSCVVWVGCGVVDMIALWNAGTCDVVGPLCHCAIIETFVTACSGSVVREKFVRCLWAG